MEILALLIPFLVFGMAKLDAPLFSFGARGKLANSLVFFPWKGINAVRKYIIPANPNTTAQDTQRGYFSDMITIIHAAMAEAANPLSTLDKTAYSLYAATLGPVMTWFNAAVRNGVNQRVAAKKAMVFRGATVTPGAGTVTITLRTEKKVGDANAITAASWYSGTSPSALLTITAATVVANVAGPDAIAGVAGQKLYIQLRPTAHADYVGTRSGIYNGTPT